MFKYKTSVCCYQIIKFRHVFCDTAMLRWNQVCSNEVTLNEFKTLEYFQVQGFLVFPLLTLKQKSLKFAILEELVIKPCEGLNRQMFVISSSCSYETIIIASIALTHFTFTCSTIWHSLSSDQARQQFHQEWKTSHRKCNMHTPCHPQCPTVFCLKQPCRKSPVFV